MKAHKYKLYRWIRHSNNCKIYKFVNNNLPKLKFINCHQIDRIHIFQQAKQFKIIIKLIKQKNLKSQAEMNLQFQALAVTQNILVSQ